MMDSRRTFPDRRAALEYATSCDQTIDSPATGRTDGLTIAMPGRTAGTVAMVLRGSDVQLGYWWEPLR